MERVKKEVNGESLSPGAAVPGPLLKHANREVALSRYTGFHAIGRRAGDSGSSGD
jgi:hypothetical protein